VFTFKLRDDVTSYSVFDISERLRARGWLVPAYTFPANLQETAVIRIVVKNGFSQDMAWALLTDLRKQVTMLEAHPRPPVPLADDKYRESFRH
jgi:glutamate decarboxylase